jgi:hypothetical protein
MALFALGIFLCVPVTSAAVCCSQGGSANGQGEEDLSFSRPLRLTADA